MVVSYTLFRLDYEAYAAQKWAGLVLDEAQFVKNPATKASQNARRFPAPFKLAITGTPMENNLMELWSMFAITAPGLFPSSKNFAELLPEAGGERGGRGETGAITTADPASDDAAHQGPGGQGSARQTGTGA